MISLGIDESWEATGRRLRLLRLYSRIENQELFAKTVNVSQGDWSKYETGGKVPRSDVALRIVHRWGVTTDWIYRGDDRLMPLDMLEKFELILNGEPQKDSA